MEAHIESRETTSMRAEKQAWDLAVSRVGVTFLGTWVAEGTEGIQTGRGGGRRGREGETEVRPRSEDLRGEKAGVHAARGVGRRAFGRCRTLLLLVIVFQREGT